MGVNYKWMILTLPHLLPPFLKEAVHPFAWKKCYTKHDIQSCVARVQTVGFNEKRNLYGALTISSCSSGYAIGSCNWVITSEYEKVCYVSGTSTLTTHPKPVDQASLRNSDVLILSCLTQTPSNNPDAMIGDFCVNAAVTLKNGGNVLVPCYPSGITYDLFECLSGHLDSCGLSQVPLYFVSPVSDSALAYSNIFAEWLSASKQSRVYLPEAPFPHAELVAIGRLKNCKSIHDGLSEDFKPPCVVFSGHPSLRMGDAVHFLEMWGNSSSNTIIFTEPDFPFVEALSPYQPLQIRVCYCPIDTCLRFSQANKLIKDLKPTHLVVADSYIQPPVSMPHKTEFVINWTPTLVQAAIYSRSSNVGKGAAKSKVMPRPAIPDKHIPASIKLAPEMKNYSDSVFETNFVTERLKKNLPKPQDKLGAYRGDNKSKNIIKPATFDGQGSLIDYKSHFDACSRINGWTESEKGLYLAVSLRGQGPGGTRKSTHR
ncbi:integrator complex subunit 9 [Mytilus galloprovincialis]|uniref:Integrator complex subunit 9 n=1 Tax=Mytilus galloprovincialis TaxID=29158 RepID=A0A8B6DD05_MYTGA|nr:integrator complex subunit 9 [Mytilus galloprovincialis]